MNLKVIGRLPICRCSKTYHRRNRKAVIRHDIFLKYFRDINEHMEFDLVKDIRKIKDILLLSETIYEEGRRKLNGRRSSSFHLPPLPKKNIRSILLRVNQHCLSAYKKGKDLRIFSSSFQTLEEGGIKGTDDAFLILFRLLNSAGFF